MNKGFTLLEIMVSMAIGLLLLSTLMTFWLSLSKNAHREIIKLGLAQDDTEAVEYLRSTLGKAIYEPNCLNPEWLIPPGISTNIYSELLFKNKGVAIHQSTSEYHELNSVMQNSLIQFPNLSLGNYSLRTLEGSDLIEMLYLTPLSVADNKILNSEGITGSRVGSVLVTDCRSYLLGEYERNGNDYLLNQLFSKGINQYLLDDRYHQYYKVNRLLIYVIYEQGKYFLIYNFLDGSNFIRFPNIQSIKVSFDSSDNKLLNIQFLISGDGSIDLSKRQFYLRLLNL